MAAAVDHRQGRDVLAGGDVLARWAERTGDSHPIAVTAAADC
jgi:hypothetical protein